jgi:hypothetical protein
MPYAQCTACGEVTRWRATAGAKLSELKCPHCGGPLKGKGGKKGPRGHQQHCVICGRIRYKNYRTAPEDKTITLTKYRLVPGQYNAEPYSETLVIKKGDPLCWHMHETKTGWQR